MQQSHTSGRLVYTKSGMPRYKRYLDESPGVLIQSVWTDVPPVNSQASEDSGYPTQKPVALLERIIGASSDEEQLVLDCFCGSGTTPVVAEKLGRRWIAADLGRFAIHTTRKRLLSLPDVKPFVVQNLGKYERQAWQVAEFGDQAEACASAYRRFILDLYNARHLTGYAWLHGLKNGRMVHVGTVDAPVSPGDVAQIAAEFRRAVGTGAEAPRTNGVDVIGNKAFIAFVEQLEREEDLELGTFNIGRDPLVIVTIGPDQQKLDKDIALPVLSPILARKKTLAEEIAALDVAAMTCPALPRKQGAAAALNFHYEGYDIITLQKLIERDYTIPEPQMAQGVISCYAKRIAREVKLPSQFAALVPKVGEFLATKAFGEPVDLETVAMIKAISSNVAQYVTVKTFAGALRDLVLEELTPQLANAGRRLSETLPFPYSRPTLPVAKTVFNLVACDNDFEKRFAQFLQEAPDVAAFAKLPLQFGFAIEYSDSASNLRYYEPDFVAVLTDGSHYLLETKGREDVDVAHKDRAAMIWSENASLLTGTPWCYLKVPQNEFGRLQPADFADLLVLATPTMA